MEERPETPTMINLNTGIVVQLKHSYSPQITMLRFPSLWNVATCECGQKKGKSQPHAHVPLSLAVYLPARRWPLTHPHTTSALLDLRALRRSLLTTPISACFSDIVASWFSPSVSLMHLIRVCVCVCVCLTCAQSRLTPCDPTDCIAYQVTLSVWLIRLIPVCVYVCVCVRISVCVYVSDMCSVTSDSLRPHGL